MGTCPGPAIKRTPKYPCVTCQKAVRRNSKAVSCDNCKEWTHIKCGEIPLDVYNATVQRNDDLPFVCSRCALVSVPGTNLFSDGEDDIDSTDVHEDFSSTESFKDDSQWQCFRKRGLYFLHLSARSLLPKMEEFLLVA